LTKNQKYTKDISRTKARIDEQSRLAKAEKAR